MIDTLKLALARMEAPPASLLQPPSTGQPPLPQSRYAVLTLHRQGLVDDPLLFRGIWQVLRDVARNVPIIFPVHPRTHLRLRSLGFESRAGAADGCGDNGIHMIPPLGYMQFLNLQKRAALVMTDSGGVQEETTALGVPCLTLRENTERPYTVTHGTNRVVGFDAGRIRHEIECLLRGPSRRTCAAGLWDGRASERIVRILRDHFAPSKRNDHALDVPAVTAQLPVLRRWLAESW